MSRIGARPIKIEEGVNIETVNRKVKVSYGQDNLELTLPEGISIVTEDSRVLVKRSADSKELRALHGLTARLLANAMKGVKDKFKKELTFTGTGYRAAVNGNELVLNMGYSHEVKLQIPEELTVTAAKNSIVVIGAEKDRVGEFAANVRAVRGPEVYKGKGIKYKDEHIRRKAGKTAASK